MTSSLLGSAPASMGHKRLGTLPRKKRWQQVVASFDNGESVARIAAASTVAAEGALSHPPRYAAFFTSPSPSFGHSSRKAQVNHNDNLQAWRDDTAGSMDGMSDYLNQRC